MVQFGEFLKTWSLWSNRSVLLGQKLVEKDKIQKFTYEILSNFQTMWVCIGNMYFCGKMYFAFYLQINLFFLLQKHGVNNRSIQPWNQCDVGMSGIQPRNWFISRRICILDRRGLLNDDCHPWNIWKLSQFIHSSGQIHEKFLQFTSDRFGYVWQYLFSLCHVGKYPKEV